MEESTTPQPSVSDVTGALMADASTPPAQPASDVAPVDELKLEPNDEPSKPNDANDANDDANEKLSPLVYNALTVPSTKSVIVMRGIPGSGKSTVAHQVCSQMQAVSSSPVDTRICSADHFFLRPNGQYVFNPKLLGRAHAACLSRFVDGLAQGAALVIVDNTHSARWEYDNYVKIAQAMGYKVHIWEMLCADNQTLALYARRNTHRVPVRGCEAMRRRWERDTRATLIDPKYEYRWIAEA